MKPSLTNEMPLYEYYSENCIFLGSYKNKDFYFSEDTTKKNFTLIVRLSNKPTDYFCMPAKEAKLALELDLMDDDAIFAICYKRYLEHIKH